MSDFNQISIPAISLDEKVRTARIKVLGVGGAGNNAVDEMIMSNMEGVEFIAINTDSQALERCLAQTKIQIGNLVSGLGAGGNPDKGRQAAIEDREKLMEIIKGADLVFVTAGMGGGTGTGASPVIAEIARELQILTVAVVTTPFAFEMGQRMKQALEGIQNLKDKVDSYIIVPNEKLIKMSEKGTTLVNSFAQANEVLKQSVQGISELILKKGLVNRDFADVETVLQGKGRALMGTGISQGDNRALQAIENAISSPLLEDVSIDGAMGALFNVCGDESVTIQEVNSAIGFVRQKLHPEANIFWGAYIDSSMNDAIKFTVIISGLPESVHKSTTIQEKPVAKAEAAADSKKFLRLGKTPTPSTLEDIYDVSFDGEEAEFMIPAYQRKKEKK